MNPHTGEILAMANEPTIDWLLENLLEKTPGTRHALVLSRDGLKLCLSPGLSVDQADQLAAIASGIQSLSHGASIEFGDGTKYRQHAARPIQQSHQPAKR